jgi:primosomal protein N' (replication factor Y)
LSLNDSDYRCGERTFQLLTQAAGRAGRGKKPGEVVIQTYRPEHYSIVRAARQDYNAFYEEEMLYRELAGYPPASHMLAVLISAQEEEAGEGFAGELARAFQKTAEEQKVQVIGPVAASISKINDIYRFVIYCKHKDYDVLVACKDAMEAYISKAAGKGQNVQFDFDPVDSF